MRRIAAENTEAHDADGHLAGRRLVVVVAPQAPRLLRVVEPLAAVTDQDVQHDIFAHAHGEIGIDHAHHRHVGQFRIGEQVIDAGAETEDRLQARASCASRPGGGFQTQA